MYEIYINVSKQKCINITYEYGRIDTFFLCYSNLKDLVDINCRFTFLFMIYKSSPFALLYSLS